jgi:hypothetical protein
VRPAAHGLFLAYQSGTAEKVRAVVRVSRCDFVYCLLLRDQGVPE